MPLGLSLLHFLSFKYIYAHSYSLFSPFLSVSNFLSLTLPCQILKLLASYLPNPELRNVFFSPFTTVLLKIQSIPLASIIAYICLKFTVNIHERVQKTSSCRSYTYLPVVTLSPVQQNLRWLKQLLSFLLSCPVNPFPSPRQRVTEGPFPCLSSTCSLAVCLAFSHLNPHFP